MADINSSKWMEEDVLNVAPPPDGLPAGTPPTSLYDIIRADKGAVKRKDTRENPRKISSGTGAAYVLTFDVGPTEFVRGDRYAFIAHVANTGPASLKVNAQAARSIVNNDGSPITANQINKDQVVEVAFDGTSFRLLSTNTANPAFTGLTTVENINVTGTATTKFVSADGGSVYINAAGNRHVWFRAPDNKVTGLIFNNGTNNSLALRAYSTDDTSYKEMTLQTDGQLILPTAPTSGNAAATKTYVDNAFNKTVTAGNGLTGGGTISGGVTITLGAPTTVTNSTTNSVTATGHTHALTLVAGDITGALGYTPQTPAQVSSAITTATNGNMNGYAYPRRVGGVNMQFNWSGQGGQPTWVWGGSDGVNMYVYNPSNFNVNSVGGWTQATISNQIEGRASAWATQEARNRSVFNAITGQVSLNSHGQEWQNTTGYDLMVQGLVSTTNTISLRAWNTSTGVTCTNNQFCRVRQGESIRIERSGSGSYSWTGYYFGTTR